MERLHRGGEEEEHYGHRSSAACFDDDVFLSLSCGGSSSSSSSEEAAATGTAATPPCSKLCGRRRRGRDDAFECRTCGRQFATFQALGGHRTSHLRHPAVTKHRPKAAVVVHACAACGLGFSTGQALGGHMRRHRRRANCMVDSADVVDPTQQITVYEKPSSASLQLLDLFV